MLEKEFINKLKKELDIFKPEKVENLVAVYQKQIAEKKQNGIAEEEAVKSCGKIEDIVNQIYEEHGLKKKSKKSFFYQKFEELFEVIHRVVDVMSNNTMKENLSIFGDLLILIFFIILIKIPFIVVESLGDSLFEAINSSIALTIWGFTIDLVYIIVAIMVFMNIFTKWFKNLKTNPKKPKPPKELEVITLNNEKEKPNDSKE